MKNKIFFLLFSLFVSCSTLIQAKDGTVYFNGDIINSPCVVATESKNQIINLGQIAVAKLINGGVSIPKPFQIILEDCSIESSPILAILFTGEGDIHAPELISLMGTGSAKNVAIELLDYNGEHISLNGKFTIAQEVKQHQNILNFSARYRNTTEVPISGHANGVTDFNIIYK
ncbi:fimbrial protein [Moellerella wisconsensis]|uniref:Fimbrial protein n=2 Tax=Moellerella wisconsensis TaxID=158849 RepID=A0A9Q8V3G0_9GAMM|nr:fimbrial protein [Moellerella wisconsensis]UNH24296.1 fimbrial protein [Moellerella wisconsensis]UNH27401.1 fimbrial protein [Moellerella wisconsensis]UNH30875.1 fimbrial protein [Moellerella wisconsensis]UNH39020.1 fimbrial protein [Moellerella wisconsensis]UNH42539.1 fimbrial protein [Moellerella wisconsensis]